ncbi:DUF4332 domain-containing protein [Methylonatrum kenyense]|uniref:DUF4332 domain-containing protein n=1 Tax=Methylonatrum kenyense TaxID=455253 RepID=UPI0020BE19E9|nr:DUF4332 domain-containing protein [Methylonatrum kenyense]MCK8516906.1 DUF4332 domain-containing protein [Methylonatrum kenyense]
MWSDFVKRWMDMAFWWLPDSDRQGRDSASRSQATPTREPPKPRSPEPAVTTEEVAEEVAADGDDLTAIKGVGPAMAEKLRHMGITTFSDLAAVDPEALTADLKRQRVVISVDRVKGWKQEAGARQPAT